MKKLVRIVAVGAVFAAPVLLAQGRGIGSGAGGGAGVGSGEGGFYAFQQAGGLATTGTRITVTPFVSGRGAVVTGSPLSATEETKTVQTLGDGTVLENSDSSSFYRDNDGRTRTEQNIRGNTTVSIIDPVAGVRLTLDPETKSATRMQMAVAGGRGARGGVAAPAPTNANAVSAFGSGLSAGVAARGSVLAPRQNGTPGSEPAIEDLGTQMVNGVLATGVRTTVTIPAGQIGNNRDIHVVNERWYSKDLQMLVKTVNSDPRYGVTTYELSDIVQAAPDAALFEIPAGYSVTEIAGRGGALLPAAAGARGGR